MQQCFCFSEDFKVNDQEKPKTGKGSGKKRGKYKPRKKVIPKMTMWQILDDIKYQIAMLLDSSLMFKYCEEFTRDYKYFTLYYLKYVAAPYEYQGEIFQGDNFKIIQAELKGTENLHIKENLFIHQKLLQLIQINYELNEAALLLQPLILKFRKGEVIFSDHTRTMEQN